ncbi:hypothetical protein [Arthrobacter bambusae]|uniref:Uncharacterized protein n=1 Tax=Arthrobacter bambusae TaxID=1338426 RepID=A0AAW8DCI5_9MICC|nr:hypothetical protein [Arthrobacter bambusae]MDP9903136.1 hypothetical protein [Arthrobacter bambusae]MDQ0128870.1 hypothetical protein [Arthrobacter bambusae]MDQ0180211.1 hypothetical protein [Arthrobacter bambusae]
MSREVEWEAEIKIRRNGRLVKRESALGETPKVALYFAENDLMRWAEDHPDTQARFWEVE